MTQPVIDLARHKGWRAPAGISAQAPGPAVRLRKNPGAGPLFFLSGYAPPAC